jgi:hypothetical protein
MPITKLARRLDDKTAIPFTPQVLSTCRRELAVRNTTCEFFARCILGATTPYRTAYSVVFLCDSHFIEVETASGARRAELDLQLSVSMYEGMLRKSYVWTNVKSDGLLDELVDAREEQIAADQRSKRNVAANNLAAQRRAISTADAKVGAPDEDLMIGRDRNDLREKLSKPRLGPTRIVPTIKPIVLPPFNAGDVSLITPTL